MPKVCEPKLGKITNIEAGQNMITIELREDFKLGEEEEEQLRQAFPDKY